MAKNSPTARANRPTSATLLHCSSGMAKGISSNPTTGTIQAGVACAACWRWLSQRDTMIQANTTMPTAPATQKARASPRL
ncbi:hypothetical protein D3C80_1787580 [compost metagenome]